MPANSSDPLYTEWTKADYNPVVNFTGDDPSTAWQTTGGEWRIVGNEQPSPQPTRRIGSARRGRIGSQGMWPNVIYGSKDFVHWELIGESEPPLPHGRLQYDVVA
eukprot:gene6116-3218_t